MQQLTEPFELMIEEEFPQGYLFVRSIEQNGHPYLHDVDSSWLPYLHTHAHIVSTYPHQAYDVVTKLAAELFDVFSRVQQEQRLSARMSTTCETLLHALDFVTQPMYRQQEPPLADQQAVFHVLQSIFDTPSSITPRVSAHYTTLPQARLYTSQKLICLLDKRPIKQPIQAVILYKKPRHYTERFQQLVSVLVQVACPNEPSTTQPFRSLIQSIQQALHALVTSPSWTNQEWTQADEDIIRHHLKLN